MVDVVLLDAGPLGFASAPQPAEPFVHWLENLQGAGTTIVVPEVADYEVRRELLRLGRPRGIRRLDIFIELSEYEPITTPIMRRAAELWAESRNRGRPLADRHALDADVILAATAEAVAARGHEVVVATTNLAHLSSLTNASLWNEIRG
jgi:predicted nucleic acid-binding protein